jgi:hypothetical protein
MRELAATGWMSNRSRQNAASFLAKELRLDWRLGEAGGRPSVLQGTECSVPLLTLRGALRVEGMPIRRAQFGAQQGDGLWPLSCSHQSRPAGPNHCPQRRAPAPGAELFESLLLDSDPASNFGNWSYVAGTGNDPRNRKFKTVTQASEGAAQCRVARSGVRSAAAGIRVDVETACAKRVASASPNRQGERYDADAELAAAWLPELAALPPGGWAEGAGAVRRARMQARASLQPPEV